MMNGGLSCSVEKCKFCEENIGRYTCPRCNMYYCSVICYKSPHHLDCSEAFFRECVEEELAASEVDPESSKKMIDILKRNYDENFSESDTEDSDDDIDLAERMNGIDLDDTEEVWSKLTQEEQKAFLELANCGDITKFVPLWEPWWNQIHKKPIVRFCDEPDSSDSYKELCPEIRADIQPLNNISKSNPSPLIFNNVLNVIAAYSMVTRFLNGEQSNSPDETCSLLLELSKNLSENVTFDTLDLALESVSSASINCQAIGATTENINQMRSDVAKISLGPNEEEPLFYLLAALSDVNTLLNSTIKSNKQHSSTQSTTLPVVFEKKIPVNFNRKQFMLAEKKLHYYLSWVTTCYSDIIMHYKNSLPTAAGS